MEQLLDLYGFASVVLHAAELVARTASGPQGQTGHLEDSLVVVRRLT